MANRKAVQKYIPTVLVKRSEIIADKIANMDYTELGFLTPPSSNDVLKYALAIGLKELEKMVGIKPKVILEKDTQELEQNEKPKGNKPKSKFKDILGDFG